MAYSDLSTLPTDWRILRFEQFLKPVERRFLLEDDREYRLCGVRRYGKGAFIREVKQGREAKLKGKNMICRGDVIYSKLFAWRGSFAVIEDELDGCCISDEFPIYQLDDSLVLPDYLRYYFQTDRIRDDAARVSKGVSAASRFHLHQADFARLQLPVPPLAPLDEQRRIVARIDALAGRIAEAQRLQEEALKEAEALLASMTDSEYSKAADRWGSRPLAEVSQINPSRKGQRQLADDSPVTFVPMAAVDAETGRITTPEVRSYGEVKCRYTLFQLGDVLWAKITPCMQNGKSAVVDQLVSSVGFGSTEFHVLRPGDKVTSAWIHRFVRRISLRQEAERHFTGSVGQQRAPQSFLEGLTIPLPPLNEQQRIVTILDRTQARVDALRRLQESTQAELAALLPAVLDKAFREAQ